MRERPSSASIFGFVRGSGVFDILCVLRWAFHKILILLFL